MVVNAWQHWQTGKVSLNLYECKLMPEHCPDALSGQPTLDTYYTYYVVGSWNLGLL